jgi:hypothetical protein
VLRGSDGQACVALDVRRRVHHHEARQAPESVERAGHPPPRRRLEAERALAADIVPTRQALLRIGVEQGYRPVLQEGHREVRGQRGLAGAALLLRHRDHERHAKSLAKPPPP